MGNKESDDKDNEACDTTSEKKEYEVVKEQGDEERW